MPSLMHFMSPARWVVVAVMVLALVVSSSAAYVAPDTTALNLTFVGWAQQTSNPQWVERDSCGSTPFGVNPQTGGRRVLWTCRDTQPVNSK